MRMKYSIRKPFIDFQMFIAPPYSNNHITKLSTHQISERHYGDHKLFQNTDYFKYHLTWIC